MKPHRTPAPDVPKWSALLVEAVNKPGMIMEAYSAFHNYSIGNQILALVQCQGRGLEPGPINTYPGWQALGRNVKCGERALSLCMPITRKVRDQDSPDETENRERTFTSFVHKPHWFVLAQTVGEEFISPCLPAWNAEQALAALHLEQITFTHTDGNCQGYARQRQIAINPVAQLPHKTLFHEAAHLCCVRSYVVLYGKVLWIETGYMFGLNITSRYLPDVSTERCSPANLLGRSNSTSVSHGPSKLYARVGIYAGETDGQQVRHRATSILLR